MELSVSQRRALIEHGHSQLSVRQQTGLLGLNRSSSYYKPLGENKYNLELMRLIDEEHTRHPCKGMIKLTKYLREYGHNVNIKRVRRLCQIMGIEAIYQKKKGLSKSDPEHYKYPYLLKGLDINRPNQVWATDITYIRLQGGFAYLVAIMDWYSRYVLSWRLSNSLESSFCIEALEEAFMFYGFPEIFNSDQGTQFTSEEFTGLLLANKVSISMDARGRAYDNIFCERLWRSVKYEEVYLHEYGSMPQGREGLGRYFIYYNEERHHQGLDYKKPAEVYFGVELPLKTIKTDREKIIPKHILFEVKPYKKSDKKEDNK